jgi:hypothetical protein
MATAPSYAVTPHNMCGLVPATADTSNTAPTNVTTLGSAASTGTKISQIDVTPVGTVVAGIVNIFIYDGSAYHLLCPVTIPAATVSTTAPPVPQTFTYDNLSLLTGWSLRCTNTVSGNVSLITVNAFGADY